MLAQDEWVVCRVFMKSSTGKKYPSNTHHRAHPYTLDMGPPLLPTSILSTDLFSRGPYGYLTPADLAELSRFARGTSGLNPHIQPHPGFGPHMPSPPPFALSGLNLNLGAPIAPPGLLRSMPLNSAGQALPTEQALPISVMSGPNTVFSADAAGAPTSGVRYQQNLEPYVEPLEGYWPSY
jgi:hypothetical protein